MTSDEIIKQKVAESKEQRNLYRILMEQIKDRLKIIDSVVKKKLTLGNIILDVELVCLELRKTLESIALGNLVCNKNEYAIAYEKFSMHWHAERIFKDLEKINPNFYPQAIEYKFDHAKGPLPEIINADRGQLTKEEFIFIYDKCADMLHVENPFGQKKDTAFFIKNAHSWHNKIVKLLDFHFVALINGDVFQTIMQDAKTGNTIVLIGTSTGIKAP